MAFRKIGAPEQQKPLIDDAITGIEPSDGEDESEELQESEEDGDQQETDTG